MERNASALSGRYLTALQRFLKQGPQAKLQEARRLGEQALQLGWETLDLARVHERALTTLGSAYGQPAMVKQARLFFAEAAKPIEGTHRAALQASANLGKINLALSRRTLALAASRRSLKQSIARRKTAEGALGKSGTHARELLQESRRLQAHLRRLAQQILIAQEGSRKQVSQDLQDEIAQILLGINVRLLTLKKQGKISVKSVKNGIADTQRLVDKSARSIKRFARDFKHPHGT